MGFWEKYFSRDIGVDLGTANTLVLVKGQGIVISEPSVVALNRSTNEVVAVGAAAKAMLGRTPEHIVAIRPLRDGVIADFEVTQKMLKNFLRRVTPFYGWVRPRVVVCVPAGVTEVERRAVKDAALSAGAREVYTIEEPMAAAIGAGLAVTEPIGSMIVDIGGGTTEVAVISLGGIVTHMSVRVAGDEMDEAIVAYVKKQYNLLIGERTAEEVKIGIGSAFTMPESSCEVRGRDLLSGLPKTITLTSSEVRQALADPVRVIVDAVKATLERTPPELAADVFERGIVLSGGGALLLGLDMLIAHETNIPVMVAEDPLSSVVQGAGRTFEHFDLLRRLDQHPRRK